MRKLQRDEVAAQRIYCSDYAAQKLGVIEWWKKEPAYRHRSVWQFLADLDKAAPERWRLAQSERP